MQLQDFTNNQPTKHQWHDRRQVAEEKVGRNISVFLSYFHV